MDIMGSQQMGMDGARFLTDNGAFKIGACGKR